MAEHRSWPAWRYGPNGECLVFVQEADVPEGWVDHPSKLPPASEKQGGGESDELRAQREKLHEALRKENEALHEDFAALSKEVEAVRAQNAELRAENEELRARVQQVPPHEQKPVLAQSTGARPRGPRKLSASPVTPKDDTVTLDEGRTERLKVLREAGITIADDATDGDIEEALDWLENNPQTGK